MGLELVVEKLEEIISYNDIFATELIKIRILNVWVVAILTSILVINIVLIFSIFLSNSSSR